MRGDHAAARSRAVADPRVPTARRRARRAAPARPPLAPTCGVGRPAGQHAPRRAPLDPCARRGDRTRPPGKTHRSSSSGGRGSTRTSSRPATSRSSRSEGCRTNAGAPAIAEDLAARLHAFLGGATMTYGEAGRALGEHPNTLRYAAPTGTVVIRWDGARQPTVWTVPPPEVDPRDARLELARRYLHIFGPTTPEAFAVWAGIAPRRRRRGVRCAPSGR